MHSIEYNNGPSRRVDIARSYTPSSDFPFRLQKTDLNKIPKDISGNTFEMYIKVGDENGSNISGSPFSGTIENATEGILNFIVPATITTNLTEGKYWYIIYNTDSSNVRNDYLHGFLILTNKL